MIEPDDGDGIVTMTFYRGEDVDELPAAGIHETDVMLVDNAPGEEKVTRVTRGLLYVSEPDEEGEVTMTFMPTGEPPDEPD